MSDNVSGVDLMGLKPNP